MPISNVDGGNDFYSNSKKDIGHSRTFRGFAFDILNSINNNGNNDNSNNNSNNNNNNRGQNTSSDDNYNHQILHSTSINLSVTPFGGFGMTSGMKRNININESTSVGSTGLLNVNIGKFSNSHSNIVLSQELNIDANQTNQTNHATTIGEQLGIDYNHNDDNNGLDINISTNQALLQPADFRLRSISQGIKRIEGGGLRGVGTGVENDDVNKGDGKCGDVEMDGRSNNTNNDNDNDNDNDRKGTSVGIKGEKSVSIALPRFRFVMDTVENNIGKFLNMNSKERDFAIECEKYDMLDEYMKYKMNNAPILILSHEERFAYILDKKNGSVIEETIDSSWNKFVQLCNLNYYKMQQLKKHSETNVNVAVWFVKPIYHRFIVQNKLKYKNILQI